MTAGGHKRVGGDLVVRGGMTAESGRDEEGCDGVQREALAPPLQRSMGTTIVRD